MRFATRTILAVLAALSLSALAPSDARAQAARGVLARSVIRDSTLRAFLRQFERAHDRFINGDARQWRQIASRAPDATIMGGWGGFERGGRQVAGRYDWAASRFRESGARTRVEYLSAEVSGDLAYTVSIERSRVRLADADTTATLALRATHVFRRENGAWRLVHRHADPLLERTGPAAMPSR